MSRLEKHRAERRRDREKPFAQDSFRETEAGNCQSAKEILGKFWLASGTVEREEEGATGGVQAGSATHPVVCDDVIIIRA